MENKKTMIALDCGNSSFRVVLGKYENNKIESEVICQIPNGMVQIGDYFYWDLLHIFSEFKKALRQVITDGIKIDSIGICTWGVDFALFDKDGNMMSNPLSYRNTIGEDSLGAIPKEEREELFRETGILCDKINSVYMLAGMKERFPWLLESASRCLMVPDILNYFMTGVMINEPSELSTTQLMSANKQEISKEVCRKFGISPKLFGKIGQHGEKIGQVKTEILEEIGAEYEIPVICVPSHDTASAVAAIPADEKRFGFISCGTWSLIGTELDGPICTENVREAELTNEVGAFGKITLLKNSSGMFIANRLKKEYDTYCKRKTSWDEITNMASRCSCHTVIDLNDSAFFNPGSMSKAIWDYLKKTGQIVEEERKWDILFRTFYESLACCYAVTISDIERVTGNILEKVYIVGGGTASKLLLSLSAKHMGKTIVVCYGESTAMGNLMTQLTYFDESMRLEDIRRIIDKSYKTEEITEKRENKEVLETYRKLIKPVNK